MGLFFGNKKRRPSVKFSCKLSSSGKIGFHVNRDTTSFEGPVRIYSFFNTDGDGIGITIPIHDKLTIQDDFSDSDSIRSDEVEYLSSKCKNGETLSDHEFFFGSDLQISAYNKSDKDSTEPYSVVFHITDENGVNRHIEICDVNNAYDFKVSVFKKYKVSYVENTLEEFNV